MNDKFNRIEILMHFAGMTHIETLTLGKYTVLYLLKADSKSRVEYLAFDSNDVTELDEDEIKDIVRSSALVKGDFLIDSDTESNYRYVRFNRFSYYENLDMFNKRFLNLTKDTRIQREFQIGQGYNPNPKLYKYVWWVFHNSVQSTNIEALIATQESRFIHEEEVEKFVNALAQKGEPYAYVRKSYPRLGVKAFDYEKMKEENPDITFAPALEDDGEYHDKR